MESRQEQKRETKNEAVNKGGCIIGVSAAWLCSLSVVDLEHFAEELRVADR